MKRSIACIALLAQCMPALAVSHVVLVQNSGWMEPFYTDSQSRFKPLITELVMAVAQPGDPMVLAAFNQALPGAPSPKALLSFKFDAKSSRKQVAGALAALDLARKPGSQVYADTDLNEAVGTAVRSALGGKPGLVWLVTNNRNSPNNDQATASRNREFYELIHRGGAITRALAYPLQMPVQGAHYRANGLMIYVFAVGEQGARELKALVASGAVAKVITEPPARLKPLDQDLVRLVPRKVSDAPGVAFSMAPGGTLRADVDAQARAPAAKIVWNLENTIYPYTIASAQISARSKVGTEDRPIKLASNSVSALAPGKGAAGVRNGAAGTPAAREMVDGGSVQRRFGLRDARPDRIAANRSAARAVAGIPPAHGQAVPGRSAARYFHAAGENQKFGRQTAARRARALRRRPVDRADSRFAGAVRCTRRGCAGLCQAA